MQVKPKRVGKHKGCLPQAGQRQEAILNATEDYGIGKDFVLVWLRCWETEDFDELLLHQKMQNGWVIRKANTFLFFYLNLGFTWGWHGYQYSGGALETIKGGF